MISLPEIKAALRIPFEDGTEDAFLEALEKSAVAAIERWTGRYFGPERNASEAVAVFGQRDAYLRESPKAGTLALEWNGASVGAADFTVDGRRLTHATSFWGSGHYAYTLRATYTEGYAPGAEPGDIRQAVVQLIGLWYEQRTPAAIGTIAPPVPFTVQAILAPWKIWSV